MPVPTRHAACLAIATTAFFAGCSTCRTSAPERQAESMPMVELITMRPDTVAGLRTQGLYAFPASDSRTLCDTADLLVRAWNDDEWLVVQAIVWNDGDAAMGETSDGRETGDNATLLIDVDADGAETPHTDVSYHLNAWPSLPGLTYSTPFGGGSSSGLQGNSGGRASMEHVAMADGSAVRVDTFVLPVADHHLTLGSTIGCAYMAISPADGMRLNSIGYVHEGARYYSYHLSHADFHSYTLAGNGASWDVASVPRGRDAIEPEPERAPAPTIGKTPPSVDAQEWINTDSEPSLESLRGKVVMVEFWATWCGPCIANIPHLNELHERYADEGLVILSLTDQSQRGISDFLERTEMNYIIGTGSETIRDYGVTGIPHAFLIGRDGTLIWKGHPAQDELERAIAKALEAG